ncbi:MAG: hypothetical protein K5819_02410 [Lachnospiraceae bacterium]|nr:hypothetical protein [Lachnospiraceae bacterium]
MEVVVKTVKFHIECTSTDAELKRNYTEFKNVCANYCEDDEMELYYIPLETAAYEYAHKLALLYPDKEDIWDESPALCVSEDDYICVEYNKKDYEDAVAYVINFYHFAYDYEDWSSDEFVGDCCGSPSWKIQNGMIQNRNYMIPKAEFGKKKYAKLMLGYAVADEVKELLCAEGLATERDFREVTTKKGEHICYQIIPENEVEGFMDENGAELVDICSNCGTKRYNLCKQPYRMSSALVSGLKGLNRTKELDGPILEERDSAGQEGRVTLEPLYIVNKQVYQLLHTNYPKMQFIPIFPFIE